MVNYLIPALAYNIKGRYCAHHPIRDVSIDFHRGYNRAQRCCFSDSFHIS
ncbi:hypothetical protein CHELA40_14273 [Chelatococcus asaccharovorans]|nr:hypothetical protein CHELA40_14273 [Chelatococcus asaccharovorans]